MGCDHNCSSCGSKGSCGEIKATLNPKSKVKKVVAVLSGKGGVGKSFVTSSLAVYLNREGKRVGILDADITGPSIPKAFNLNGHAYGDGNIILPVETKTGIYVISSNLLLENKEDPILWRGSLISNLVKQFYENVLWEDLDYLLIDMPPGTGDVALTVFQSLPIDDLIIVTAPQDLVGLIVAKALNMANTMGIKVTGVIENMSYLKCPNCDEKIPVFGESHLEEYAKKYNFDILARLPLNSENTKKMDEGRIEEVIVDEIKDAVKCL